MKWLIKNSRLLRFLLFIILIVVAFTTAFSDMKTIYVYLISLSVYVIPMLALFIAPRKWFAKIAKEYETTCDPKEYKEAIELFYKASPKAPINQANYAVALMLDKEKLHEARMIMETLPMDRIYGNTLNFVLYNNFCTLYLDLNELDKAEECYNKALELDSKIKNEAQKQINKTHIAALGCDLAIKKNDPEKALSLLEHHKQETLLQKSGHALLLGKIYLLQNEKEKAKEQLSFVVENASKINLGQEARALLESSF